MIDLGTKPTDYSISASPPKPSKEKQYPSFSLTSSKDMAFPTGDFSATVKLRTKGGDWREENGKKVCTYRFDVLGIDPEKADEPEAEEPDDAAASIMRSMKRVRNKKIEEDDGE